jgi:hypothetical protein
MRFSEQRVGFLVLLAAFLWAFQAGSGWAKSIPANEASAPATIETQWDSMWGMKYLQNGEELKEPQLKLLLKAKGDPAIDTLIDRSEDDANLAGIGLWSSIIVSIGCLALPSTQIHIGSLNIAAPYLPVQIPALALGVAAAFFTNAAGAAKFDAVQRYNDRKKRPSPVTWEISPESGHMDFDLKYRL